MTAYADHRREAWKADFWDGYRQTFIALAALYEASFFPTSTPQADGDDGWRPLDIGFDRA